MILTCPRYTDRQFPPYSYVPGHFPHPVSDPQGHMYGEKLGTPRPLEPAIWMTCHDYLYGIDLFNHGYYWESHEIWESLWHVAGRRGTIADFLKGLIKIAACTVKAREGNPRGVQRHAQRAIELLTAVSSQDKSQDDFCGLPVNELLSMCKNLAMRSEAEFSSPNPKLLIEKYMKLKEDLNSY